MVAGVPLLFSFRIFLITIMFLHSGAPICCHYNDNNDRDNHSNGDTTLVGRQPPRWRRNGGDDDGDGEQQTTRMTTARDDAEPISDTDTQLSRLKVCVDSY